ncbi:MAG TPA: FAD binding domain-containing protein [bacterium]|nr:FAD binding domain-containing protein [bacterium]
MSPYRAGNPSTLQEALAFLAEIPDLVVAAGCTDLMVSDLELRARQTHVMSVLGIEELQGIARQEDDLRIGAAVTFAQLRRSKELQQSFPILIEAARLIGGWQIQNRATIGGNIMNASPAGDSLPVLLALDAKLEIAAPKGPRIIPYESMHVSYRKTSLAPGEILAAVRIPLASEKRVQCFRKVGPRAAQAISKVVVAMSALRQGDAWRDVRVAAGSVGAIPLRLKIAEAALEGKWSNGNAAKAGRAAAGEVTPIDDVRSTAHYRSWVLQQIVEQMANEMREAS